MADLWIAESGEMKLDYEVVGQIAWASPTAHLYVTGEWEQPFGGCPFCDGEFARDELEDDLAHERRKVARLRAQLAEARAMLGITP